MSERTYNLVDNVAEGAALIADGVVVYIVAPANPGLATAVVAAITIAKEAVVRICGLFVKK